MSWLLPTLYIIIGIIAGGVMFGPMLNEDLMKDDIFGVGMDAFMWLLIASIWPALILGGIVLAGIWALGFLIKQIGRI